MTTGSANVRALRTICEYIGILRPRTCRPFRFLDLPTEIRLLIYMELFGGARAHMVRNWVQRSPTLTRSSEAFDDQKERDRGQLFHLDHEDTGCRFQSAVLRSCKTVYEEALPVLYANPIFNISIHAAERSTFTFMNAAHIRRIMTGAWWQSTMKEQDLADDYRAAGIRWDRLWLFAIDMGPGLGTSIMQGESPNSIVQAVGVTASPMEYDASDVDWLYKASSSSELHKLGISFRPDPESWYIKKGSAALRDRPSKTPKNYVARGTRIFLIDYPWAGTSSTVLHVDST